jgi:uncharacterized protein
MARVRERRPLDLDEPTLVEGLPGVGLVGKIAADHLVEELDMEYVAGIRCDGLPSVAVYRGESPRLFPPVRVYADESEDLLVLQSDIPVSPSTATEFAGCVTAWLESHAVTPFCISGLPENREGSPEVYGVATAGGEQLLAEAGITPPPQGGLVSGPTGALLAEADVRSLDAVGLVVQADDAFPDPAAARAVLEHGVVPLTGLEVDTSVLVEHAEEIRAARENLARRVAEAEDGSSRAEPIRGFQ